MFLKPSEIKKESTFIFENQKFLVSNVIICFFLGILGFFSLFYANFIFCGLKKGQTLKQILSLTWHNKVSVFFNFIISIYLGFIFSIIFKIKKIKIILIVNIFYSLLPLLEYFILYLKKKEIFNNKDQFVIINLYQLIKREVSEDSIVTKHYKREIYILTQKEFKDAFKDMEKFSLLSSTFFIGFKLIVFFSIFMKLIILIKIKNKYKIIFILTLFFLYNFECFIIINNYKNIKIIKEKHKNFILKKIFYIFTTIFLFSFIIFGILLIKNKIVNLILFVFFFILIFSFLSFVILKNIDQFYFFEKKDYNNEFTNIYDYKLNSKNEFEKEINEEVRKIKEILNKYNAINEYEKNAINEYEKNFLQYIQLILLIYKEKNFSVNNFLVQRNNIDNFFKFYHYNANYAVEKLLKLNKEYLYIKDKINNIYEDYTKENNIENKKLYIKKMSLIILFCFYLERTVFYKSKYNHIENIIKKIETINKQDLEIQTNEFQNYLFELIEKNFNNNDNQFITKLKPQINKI